MEEIYGSKGKIGLIYIATSWIMEPEFNLMAPPGVITCTTRVPGEAVTKESVFKIKDRALNATEVLAQAPLDVIALGCTSGGFIGGNDYDLKIIEEMNKKSMGIPCVTTSRAVVEAIKKMNLKKVAVFTPYLDEINEMCSSYLNENNIETTEIKGLGIQDDHEIDRVPFKRIKDEILSFKTLDECDGVFIACTALRTLPIIEELEKLINKPVISAIQATYWSCLNIIGADDEILGCGSLFSKGKV